MMIGENRGTNETWKRIPENSIGVEIGVWRGDSSEKFLRRAQHLHLVDPWSVTPYEQSDEFGDYSSYLQRYKKIVGSSDPKDFQRYYDSVYESVKRRFKDQSVTIHRYPSHEFYNQFQEKVDWVYVDGLHSFKGCLADLRGALKIVRDNGIIFGDDYGNKPGVVQAVDHFIKETGLSFNNFFKNQYEIRL